MQHALTAPFSAEQVAALNRWQSSLHVHPYTCHRGHLLVAETDGWRCPWNGCDYRQDWAHEPTHRSEVTHDIP